VTWSPSRAAKTLVLLAAAWALTGAAPVRAQALCDSGTFEERLELRYGNPECLKATQARRRAVSDAFARLEDKAPAAWMRKAGEEYAALLREVEASPRQAPYAESLKTQLATAIAQVQGLPGPHALAEREKFRALQIGFWRNVTVLNNTPGDLAARLLRDASCLDKTETDAACSAAFGRASAIGDDVLVAGQITSLLHAIARQDFIDQARLREARWHAYLYDTQFQHWWELGINRHLEEKCPGQLHGYVAPLIGRKCEPPARDPQGNPLGFRETPTYRGVFLHPDVGLQYLRHEPRGDRFKPSVVFQWVGYQWWKWQGDGAKITDLRGVSLVSTLSDNVAHKRLGWGAMVQYESYAVAFTSHSGKLAITLNLQLGGRISRLNEEWADRLKRAGEAAK
jgi:hypothetical protein